MSDTRQWSAEDAADAVVPLEELDRFDPPAAPPKHLAPRASRTSETAGQAWPSPSEAPTPTRRNLWTANERTLTASHMTEERMLRPRHAAPVRGWRRAVHQISAGLITPPPSAAQRDRQARIAAASTPVSGSRVIAFVSTKGGVGKTTTCVNLGHTFASLRGDRVIAIDGNPDAGSLGYRIHRETPATVDQLLAQADSLTRYADVRAFTSQAGSRLEVIAAPTDPSISTALGDVDYRRLLDLLEVHYQLLLVDCGTGILESATRGIVEAADQLVVVTGTSLDAARATSYLLDWLASHGHGELASEAVAVVNGVSRSKHGRVDVDRVVDHFADRCRHAVRVPFDDHLADGASTSLEELAAPTRDAYLELAAAVATDFDRPHHPTNA